MTTLLEFISGLLDGVGLIALAVAVGGIAYALIVLRAAGTLPPLLEPAARHTLKASALAAAALAIIRLLQLILKSQEDERLVGELAEVVGFFQGGVARNRCAGQRPHDAPRGRIALSAIGVVQMGQELFREQANVGFPLVTHLLGTICRYKSHDDRSCSAGDQIV